MESELLVLATARLFGLGQYSPSDCMSGRSEWTWKRNWTEWMSILDNCKNLFLHFFFGLTVDEGGKFFYIYLHEKDKYLHLWKSTGLT